MTAPSRAGLRAGALFAGIGGFCRGFHQAGVPTAWAIEVDPFAVATYTQNFPDVTTLERDVQEVSVKTADLEPVDILHAGFPCQSFSQAGIRQGFQDPRGRLFFEIIRIIREFKDRQPKALVLENTPYLRYGEGGAWFLELQREIQKAGYWFREANCAELNAYDITVLPQQRVRLFMVAFSQAHFRSGKFHFPNAKITDVQSMNLAIVDEQASSPLQLPEPSGSPLDNTVPAATGASRDSDSVGQPVQYASSSQFAPRLKSITHYQRPNFRGRALKARFDSVIH